MLGILSAKRHVALRGGPHHGDIGSHPNKGDTMFHKTRRTLATVVALGALGLGGSAIAGAASSNSTTTAAGSGSGTAAQQKPAGPHVGANGKQEQELSGDAAAKVKAAAEAKVSGGTVLRVETDVDTGSPYEAHVQKADGSQVVVYVDKSFNVTSVDAFGGPGGPPAQQNGA
jgi:hypothetical protein